MCGYGNTVIDNNLASVVCTSIGFSSYGNNVLLVVLYIIILGAKSARGVWNDYRYQYQMYNVHCYGNESSLFDCQYDNETTGSCSSNLYSAAVAVFCQSSCK